MKNEKGEVLPYASIYLAHTKAGTTSNEKGIFHLKAPKHINYPKLDTLVVSYVGYKKYKRAVYIKREKLFVNVIMESSSNMLDEFVVEALPTYPPEKIVKFAIKKIRKNYNNDNIVTNGFYRELLKEDDKWIALNEAAIQLKYAPYPQKGFTGEAFRAYYNYSSLPPRVGASSVFYHMHRFPGYIPVKKDQVKIVSSRISLNNTNYGIESSPVGGPADLISLDKIKYLYDFFDPKLIKKYNYKLISEEYCDDELCYVIDFYPKKIHETRIFQPISKKMKYPIYVGRIYISGKTFAVLNFQCQFSHNVDFSIYKNKGIPDFLKIDVKYKKYNNKWILSSVETEQRKNIKVRSKMVTYTCLRNLKLEKPIKKKVIFNNDSISYISKSTTLRYFNNKYDSKFWNSYQNPDAYPPLSKNVLIDLEQTTPLEKQFSSLNLPVNSIQQPVAKRINDQHIYFSDTIRDNYNWLSQKEDKDVLDYLTKENSYYEDVVFKISDYAKTFHYRYNSLYKHHTDTSASINYFMLNGVKCKYKQAETGMIGLYKMLNDSVYELILDISRAATGKINFFIENTLLNKRGKLAYSYTTKGDISKTLVIPNFVDNNSNYEIAKIFEFLWFNDSVIIYTKTDTCERSYQLRAFYINSKTDSLLYEEKDKRFDVTIKKSTSGDYIFIVIESLNENEYYYIAYRNSSLELKSISKRIKNHRHTIDHKNGDTFYAVTNKIKNRYEIVEFTVNNTSLDHWKTVYSTNKPIEDFYITKDYIVIQEYVKTTLQMKYIHKKTGRIDVFNFDNNIFSFDFIKKASDTSNQFTIKYESPKTPYTIYKISLESKEKQLIEQDQLTNNKKNHKIEILTAKSDETQIPISIFYNEKAINDTIQGIILKSYGAYGAKYYPEFNDQDRMYTNMGFIIAFAHVRGGGELGDDWYYKGKLLNKINTFEDYVACAKFLKKKYNIKNKQLIGYGLSAGGLIMGYVANNYPKLFGTLIFDRPYLDVLNTMMDSSLALTTMEYYEWGNPNDTVFYKYIKSYSPYQNIAKKSYPNMFFIAGYHDWQAPYWQIAKSVAKYRESNTSKSMILLNTNLYAGHRGSTISGKTISQHAAKYAFIIYCLKN